MHILGFLAEVAILVQYIIVDTVQRLGHVMSLGTLAIFLVSALNVG